MTNVILCGGSGTRLWPISRTLMPKQFVTLFGDKSLFQLTVERNAKLCTSQLVVSNVEQYFLALDQLEVLGYETHVRYVLEPLARNTAPAVALACFALPQDETLLVTPADHLIKDQEAYEAALNEAKRFADEGYLVTFGIRPKYPETGFGYIKANGNSVSAFHEKPDKATAKHYVEAGNYYWNSGMFMFKAGLFLEELQTYAPDIFDASKKAFEGAVKDGIVRITHEDMAAIPEESIDCAVMERSKRVKVVPCRIGWSDVGSFDALYEELPKDTDGNTLTDMHIGIESQNNLIVSDQKTVATVDVQDLIIINTADALLIAKKGSSQKVKEVVNAVKKTTQLHHIHPTVHRPWGSYTVLEDAQGYKIKRIVVKPGKRLSLQKHVYRSEHWVVVSGTATVTVGDKKYVVRPNESTYIKKGELHRLENEGDTDMVLIEVQVGAYTEEDDIVRYDDDFQRV